MVPSSLLLLKLVTSTLPSTTTKEALATTTVEIHASLCKTLHHQRSVSFDSINEHCKRKVMSLHLYPYVVRIILKDGRWMKPIRRCEDGKSEYYWPLDIIYIPPDFATCTIQKTPWLNLSIMHKTQNTSTSICFRIICIIIA